MSELLEPEYVEINRRMGITVTRVKATFVGDPEPKVKLTKPKLTKVTRAKINEETDPIKKRRLERQAFWAANNK